MKIEIKVNADINDQFNGFYDVEVSGIDTMNSELFDMLVEDFPELAETDFTDSDITFSVEDWGGLSDYEHLQDESLFEALGDYNGSYGLDVLNAGVYCDVAIEDIDEAYNGQYDSNEDFAEDMAEQLGYINHNASWPYTCIDWEHAARELMYDYSEEGGHYFRNS